MHSRVNSDFASPHVNRMHAVDYDTILRQLHREESIERTPAPAAPVSLASSFDLGIGLPPSTPLIEDNSILYASVQQEVPKYPQRYEPLARTAVPEGRQKPYAAYNQTSVAAASSQPAASSAAALQRIETLSIEKKRLSDQLSKLRAELEQYRDVVGPSLDAFHSHQVQLREEVLRLREELRLAQRKEHEARARIKDLELALMQADASEGRRGDDASAETRLGQLQDAIAKAYLQRSSLIQEREAAAALRKSVEWRHRALASLNTESEHDISAPPGSTSDVGGSLSHWRARGKEAELDNLLTQKETLIASLTAAAKELELVLQDTSSKSQHNRLAQLNVKCPGCGRGQWSSPFCPTTGHAHTGYTHRTPSAHADAHDPDAPRLLTADEAVRHGGSWRKVVDVDAADVSFEELATGRIVKDLDAELALQHQAAVQAHKEKAAVSALPSDAVIVDDRASSIPTAPGIDREMRMLLGTLKERNLEIDRLKKLLSRMLNHGGLAALPDVKFPDAAPYPAAQPPLQDLPSNDADQTTMEALQNTNQRLNQRCTELLCEAATKEKELQSLRNDLQRLRFGDA